MVPAHQPKDPKKAVLKEAQDKKQTTALLHPDQGACLGAQHFQSEAASFPETPSNLPANSFFHRSDYLHEGAPSEYQA